MNVLPEGLPIDTRRWTAEIDVDAIIDGVFKPENKNRIGVFEQLVGTRETRRKTGPESIEQLASLGLVPMRTLDDPRREFEWTPAGRRSSPSSRLFPIRDIGTRPSVTWTRPETRKHVVTWASDITNVSAAEELAREAARRLVKFRPVTNDTETERVVWRFLPRHARRDLGETHVSEVARFYGALLPCNTPNLEKARKIVCNITPSEFSIDNAFQIPLLPRVALVDYYCMVQWEHFGVHRVADDGDGVEYVTREHATTIDPTEELANPFKPIVDLWNLGYAFGGNTRDAVVVYALCLT